MARMGNRERFRRVRCIQRDVTKRMQLRQYISAHQIVIFDHQNRFVTAFDGGAAAGRPRATFLRPAADTS